MNVTGISKRIIAFIVMLLMLCNPLIALAAKGTAGVIDAKTVKMRAGAKSSSKLLYTLKKGTELTVIGTKKGIAKVSYKGKTGYIKASALAKKTSVVQAQPVVQAKPAVKAVTAVTTKKAVLYKSAKTSSKKLKTISKGTKVSVISTNGNWKKVTVSGKTGYMPASAFVTAAATPAPTPQPKAASKGQDMLTTAKAKMYQKASTSAKSVSVPSGATVEVISQNSKWSKVSYNGKGGYMPNTAFMDTIERKAKMYQKASTKAKSVSVSSGAKVTVLSKSGDWIKIQKGSKKGYVKAIAFEEPEPTATPVPTPEPQVMKTTVKAAMYQKASTSSKHVSVAKGKSVTILSETGNWYKVKISSKTGFMKQSAFQAPSQATPTPSPTPSPTSNYSTLKSGNKGDAVKQLQQRLESLGYFDGVPAGNYGSLTVAAVKRFQSENGITSNGTANSATQQKLFSSSAKKSSILSASLKKGSTGSSVTRLQNRLSNKGYFVNKVNGTYGDTTVAAVKAYQKKAGLSADGNAGSSTMASLFSSNAPSGKPEATVKPSATPAPSNETPGSNAPSASASKKKKADTVIAAAMSKLGKPYVFGATGPNAYDCSGFTMYAYAQVGIKLPHSAYSQGYSCGSKVSMSQLVRGDLVCWNTISDGDLSDHVGIYLGNGQAIHASSGTGKVIISSISSGYYQRAFSWGRALF
ncbi:SH3 domain-containing protein [Eubacteriales bacterium OttesenSCG-928-N13]|nr:SH3 domain-containing protein [Eubacteriales bacterium OttesenSCG-928-N13]